MRSRGTERAAPVAALVRIRRRRIAITILLMIVASMVMPVQVFAYNEAMAEIVICSDPGVIIQNQSYSTSTRQDLFHTASNAITDTEAFAFSGSSPAGLQLAQTSSLAAAGTETGFFRSTASSDIVPPVHIGNGFLGTWIGDPLWTGAPIFSGLMFPQMTRMKPEMLAAQPQGLAASGGSMAVKSDEGANKTKYDVATFQPVIDNDLNKTIANQSAKNASAAANATRQNASSGNATVKPAATPSPAIKPGQVFYHQQNKPFSAALTSPSGPFKATPASIQNTTGFDRFLRNTVGRSTTDKAFNGTTSSPTYISPGEALAEQIPYDFIQGARGMTMPGTHLNCRAWPL